MTFPTPPWANLRWLPALLLFGSAWAGPLARTPQVTVDLIAEPVPLQSGQSLMVGLRFRPTPGWHIYWSNPGDSGMPPSIEWKLPPGFTASPLQFPFPNKILLPPLVSYGYEEETILLATLTPPADWKFTSPVTFGAQLDWLACKEACLPAHASLTLEIPKIVKPDPALTITFQQSLQKLPIQVPSIRISAQRSARILDLLIQVPTSSSFEKLSFFPDSNDWLDEFASAEIKTSSDGVHLRLPLKEHAQLPSTITGLLVAEKSWDSEGHRALQISVPLAQVSSATSNLNPNILLTLLFAFLGGLILNIMPCVFPILSLKALPARDGPALSPLDSSPSPWLPPAPLRSWVPLSPPPSSCPPSAHSLFLAHWLLASPCRFCFFPFLQISFRFSQNRVPG
ncbi:MAG: protein-disulfide reductase DsbD family protein [Verrucomicrobia bacterium]|nr:protein-disulfide reductase DsbD family protein [Verrucomicrobiota bacterium]